MTTTTDFLVAWAASKLNERGVRVYRERLADDTGAIAVEYAAMIVIALGLIVIAGVAIAAKLRSNAAAIPDQIAPPP
jgi:Flp pilus assembly pilin Flp